MGDTRIHIISAQQNIFCSANTFFRQLSCPLCDCGWHAGHEMQQIMHRICGKSWYNRHVNLCVSGRFGTDYINQPLFDYIVYLSRSFPVIKIQLCDKLDRLFTRCFARRGKSVHPKKGEKMKKKKNDVITELVGLSYTYWRIIRCYTKYSTDLRPISWSSHYLTHSLGPWLRSLLKVNLQL